MSKTTTESKTVAELFSVGAHFGFGKSRRHPSVSNFIFGSKNRTDIFDLEKTEKQIEAAEEFIKKIAETKGTILFIGGKNEARGVVEAIAKSADLPYVAGRWIGGALTNFGEIRKRVDTMLSLISQKEKGELSKYTKKERLLIDRDIEKLERMFGGIRNMTNLPKAIFVVDSRFEETAVKEAKNLNIPVIAICGSDNNIKDINYPITANDTGRTSIKYIVERMAKAYRS